MEQETNNRTTIYHTGAYDGLHLGLYMSVAFLLQAFSSYWIVLSFLSTLMVIGIPFYAYRLMLINYKQFPAHRAFSTVWMQGISIFLFGALILGVVQYVYTRFIDPTFIGTLAQEAANTYLEMPSPEAQRYGHLMQNIIDQHMLPTSIGFAFTMMWVVCMSGTLLSALLAGILRFTQKRKEQEVEEEE